MSETNRQKLQQAYNLIKANQRREAGEMLVELLKTDRDNADAWWLLANASTKPEQQEKALGHVLRLRPGDDRAQKMLDKIRQANEPPPRFTAPSSASWMSTPTPDPTPTVNENDWMANIPHDNLFGGPEPDDPFADIENKPVSALYGTTSYDNPFGDPFAETSADEDDPFASEQREDPFGEPRAYDELFGPTDKAKRGTQRRSSNPASALLIVVLVIVIIGGACYAIVMGATNAGISAFNQIVASDPTLAAAMTQINDPTLISQSIVIQSTVSSSFSTSIELSDPTQAAAMENFLSNDPTLAAMMTQISDPDQVSALVGTPEPFNVALTNARGRLSYGEPRRATVDDFTDDSWTFSGASGDRLIIEVKAYNSDVDTELFIYDSNGQLLGENDDINLSEGNTNSRLEITLPRNGTYTIVVSAFGFGGEYELRINR